MENNLRRERKKGRERSRSEEKEEAGKENLGREKYGKGKREGYGSMLLNRWKEH